MKCSMERVEVAMQIWNMLLLEPLAKVFHSWFDKLTMNGISICYTGHPEPVEG